MPAPAITDARLERLLREIDALRRKVARTGNPALELELKKAEIDAGLCIGRMACMHD